ncbi:PRD domain-containing protein [Virgibacillus halophilus]|uniref:PRD domain-containing protein n=1 Tax=Tigheibacillus halophilus TaxID=361280 RepID=A0ABU5C319_9BACI|nr:PRD domain-containing protein [Virgibacillus halophilus]
MNARQKQLLILLLNESDYKSTSDFAAQLQCSIRTAYHDFHEIEQYLQTFGFRLDKKQGLGIRLAIGRKERMDILSKVDGHASLMDRYSIKNRQKWIALKLLHQEGYMSMQQFADACFVSKTAIAHDIDEIEQWLEAAGIKMERNHYGIMIRGKEEDIRSLISELVSTPVVKEKHDRFRQTNRRLDETSYNHLIEWFSPEMVGQVEKVIERLEKLNRMTISDLYYINVLTHILILIKRTQQGHYSNISVQTSGKRAKPILKRWTVQIVQLLKDYAAITVPVNEAGYIAFYIFHCTMRQPDDLLLDHERETALDGSIQKMIEMFSRILAIDIRYDKQLENGLKLHIEPMLERMQYHLKLKNPMLPHIKSRYHSIFGMTWLIMSYLENQFHIQLNDDEVGYITIHFLAALERRNRKKGKRVVIVCYGGVGTSQFLANRIQNTIPEMDIIDVVPSYKLSQIDLDTFDFVIATESISFSGKPVVEVSPILDEQDVRIINQYIFEDNHSGGKTRKTDEREPSRDSSLIFGRLIDTESIFIRQKVRNKQEAIHFLCDAAHRQGYVDHKFKKNSFEKGSSIPYICR